MDQYITHYLNSFLKDLIVIVENIIKDKTKKQIISSDTDHIAIFISNSLSDNHDNEFIIDLELNLSAKTAVLFHLALPKENRNQGYGSLIVNEIEKKLNALGIQYVSLPAEHHSTDFWLKLGYQFKFLYEKEFYRKNIDRHYPSVAYELEKYL